MKIDSFELFLDNDKQFYMAGDEVIGHIELVVNQRVRIARLTIQLTGIVQTCWRERVCVFYFWARGLLFLKMRAKMIQKLVANNSRSQQHHLQLANTQPDSNQL